MSDFMSRLQRGVYHAEAESKEGVTVRLSLNNQGVVIHARMPVKGKVDSVHNAYVGWNEIECAPTNILPAAIDRAIIKVRK